MYKYKMGSLEALIFARRKRKEINPNEGFLFQLKKYEEKLGVKEKWTLFTTIWYIQEILYCSPDLIHIPFL